MAMEQNMLLELPRDKIGYTEIRPRAKVRDAVEELAKMKSQMRWQDMDSKNPRKEPKEDIEKYGKSSKRCVDNVKVAGQ